MISHGWNNHIEEARDLYRRFFEHFVEQVRRSNMATGERRFAVMGVLWPSKKFADESLIPGGAAGVGDDALTQQLEELKGGFDARDADKKLDQAKALVERLEDDPAARRKFADLVRGLVPKVEKEPDAEKGHRFFKGDSAKLCRRSGCSCSGHDERVMRIRAAQRRSVPRPRSKAAARRVSARCSAP